MKRSRLVSIVMLVGVALCGILSAGAAAQSKPNVVFILADDLGWTDLGCQGSKYYESPNIDRLAGEGMRFTDGYTCGPNCAPTRAALMTGQYGPRTGLYTVGGIERFNWESRTLRPVDNVPNLRLDKMLLSQPIKQAGYVTGMFGKWHLGSWGEHHPSKRGFDEALVTDGKHFDFQTNPPVEYPKGQYLADFLTDRAVDFIKRQKDQPFFLYLPHFGVHSPWQAKPELIEKFKNKPPVGGHKDPTYAAMIYSVDESVGRIMATLDELGLAENTLVIFSSDNGGVGGYARAGVPSANDKTDNAPLRGGKGMFYEGGVRVPFIFRWKGKIAAGTTSPQPIISVDLYPTFLEITSAKKPDQVLEGESLMPVLTSDGSAKLSRDAIYWHFPGYLGAGEGWRTTPVGTIRVGDMKLLEFFEDKRLELYNLKADISETNNLADAQPDVVKSMHKRLVDWRQEVGAKMPTPNEPKQGAERPRRRRNRQNDGDA